MNSRFNYIEALNGIKAGLFDIYEDQEQEIGLEEDEEKRNTRLNKFIEVKNVALMLIEGIEYLYEDDTLKVADHILDEKLENPDISEEVEKSKILNLVEDFEKNSIKEEEKVDNSKEVESDFVDNELEENENVSFIEPQEENFDFEEEIEDNSNVLDKTDLKKYYLTCDMKDVNFAYVSQGLYERIKESGNLSFEQIQNDEFDEENKDLNIYKIDEEKVRGIIVRSDQYMKLALSRHRQESVLEEAREFRIQEAKKRQREEQQRELEKARVKIDI